MKISSKRLEKINDKIDKLDGKIILEWTRWKLYEIHETWYKKINLDTEHRLIDFHYQWDDYDKSLFIESLIFNFPTPTILLIGDFKYDLIDGKQRLDAVYQFYNNDFKLKGLEILKELNNLKYEDLPYKVNSLLNRRVLNVQIILQEFKDKDKFETLDYKLYKTLFSRLNK